MKYKIYTGICVLAALSFIACSKPEEQGFVITAGDNNIDTTQNEQVDAKETTNTENQSTDTSDDAEVDDNITEQSVDNIIGGYWITSDGIYYYFGEDANDFGIFYEDSTKDIYGTYESDFKTYVTVTYTSWYAQEYSAEEQKIIDEYEKMKEDTTSYVYLRDHCASYEILNQTEALDKDIEIEAGQFVLVAYDENGEELGNALYDPATDINNIHYIPTGEEVSITYNIKTGKTADDFDALQLNSNTEEIIMSKQY